MTRMSRNAARPRPRKQCAKRIRRADVSSRPYPVLRRHSHPGASRSSSTASTASAASARSGPPGPPGVIGVADWLTTPGRFRIAVRASRAVPGVRGSCVSALCRFQRKHSMPFCDCQTDDAFTLYRAAFLPSIACFHHIRRFRAMNALTLLSLRITTRDRPAAPFRAWRISSRYADARRFPSPESRVSRVA